MIDTEKYISNELINGMKNMKLKLILIVVVVALAWYNIYSSYNDVKLSDLSLINVEALASSYESDYDCTGFLGYYNGSSSYCDGRLTVLSFVDKYSCVSYGIRCDPHEILSVYNCQGELISTNTRYILGPSCM